MTEAYGHSPISRSSHGMVAEEQGLRSPAAMSKTPRSLMGAAARAREWNGLEDVDGVLSNVAHCIEQLRSHYLSPADKEQVSKQLLELADSNEEHRLAVGTHAQAIPALVALLRSGTVAARISAAATLGVLCKSEDLRVKVLLGGCVPLFLALLKSPAADAQLAAAKAILAVSQVGGKDYVGAKIFATEGVVANLWEQLQPRFKRGKFVDGLLTGALRNLCNTTEGFWTATMEAQGFEVLVGLLSSGSALAQTNASSLLASLLDAATDDESHHLILSAGAIKPLLNLVLPGNEISVRAEASGALKALSSKLQVAKDLISECGGVSILVSATVAPSKEFMRGEFAQALQENAMGALANILGGMPAVILSLGRSIQSSKSKTEMADMIGALANALMVLDGSKESLESINAVVIEKALVKQLQPFTLDLKQERSIEALASLYGNSYLAQELEHAEAKRMLVGLITMANEAQEDLMKSLTSICCGECDLWHALKGREGVQLLISLLGLSSEQQQEYAAALLSILSQEVGESKWAITAAGGIPPLVQLLETGSAKAKEDSAVVLGNLCSHNEDIRACVETAEAVPALLWLLKNAGMKGQEIAARALIQLVRDSDASTVSQLTALLTGDLPESKVNVLDVVLYMLNVSSQDDIAREGSAENEALQTVTQLLGISNEETKAKAASTLAALFNAKEDLRENPAIVQVIRPLIDALQSGAEQSAMEAARALAALFQSILQNKEVAGAARNAILPLISLATSSHGAAAEVACMAIANLLLDPEIAEEAPAEDIIAPLTKVLQKGSQAGRQQSAGALARLLCSRPIGNALAEVVHQSGTVLALVALLETADLAGSVSLDPLDALASLVQVKRGTCSRLPWSVLAEFPQSMGPLVTCLAEGLPSLQEKAIEVLARLCHDQPVFLGDLIASKSDCIAALAERVMRASSVKVKVGGTQLLICAAKERRQTTMEVLAELGYSVELIESLVKMLGYRPEDSVSTDHDVVADSDRSTDHEVVADLEEVVADTEALSVYEKSSDVTGAGVTDAQESDMSEHDPASISGAVALRMLCYIASHDGKSKMEIMKAGAIDVLTEKLALFVPNVQQEEVEDHGSTWLTALLLAILFQDRDVTRDAATMRAIPSLATLLKSDEAVDRYFAAQALASLVCNGNRGTLLAVANSGAAGGLISLLGSVESDMINLIALSEEFQLVRNPDQVALERLFRVDDIKHGATARKAVPALVELLKPTAERPGAPPLALGLLTQIAKGNNSNKLAMAEAGALDKLTKYLSLGPQDATEEATADLLRVLFSCADLRKHESALGAVDQLVAVLRLGTRGSRYSAARALQGLFAAENIKAGDAAGQAIPPLVEMLNSGLEKDQFAAIGALIKLAKDNPLKALAIADAEANAVEALCRVLSSDCSLEVKEDAAELCRILFLNSRVRSTPAATSCIQPLVSLLLTDSTAQYAGARALDNLLDDEQQAEAVAANGAVVPLVALVFGQNSTMHEAAVSALIKLAKDRPLCKLDMVKAGLIDNVLSILPTSPDSVCGLSAELLRILTNNSSIAKGASAAKVVQPLFLALSRPELSPSGQHSAMQVLVNILEKPQRLAAQNLTPNEAIEPLIPLLDSPSQPVQQITAELLSHLLVQEHFQRDMITQQVVEPLVRMVGAGSLSLQKEVLKALESASYSWPNAVADAGGITELSKIILQVDPHASHALWEAAALVLSNVLRFSAQYYSKLSVAVLVKLLRSSVEANVVVALSALLILERDDASSAESMAEAGAVEAMLELLRSHQCEEGSAQLLEALFNNVKVREMKSAKAAISPLSQYLLDPQTQAPKARLLAALALGDLFQQDGLSRHIDAVSACRALVSLLEDQPSEEMKMVAVCALQNLVMYSRSNKRAVAEAGGIQVVQDLLMSSNPDTSGQAATLIKLLFANHTIQEYASSEILSSLAASLEKDLWATASVNEDSVKAIVVLFNNFPRLRASEAATLSIAQLVGALKAGSEAAQEAALDALYLLRQAWSTSPAEVGKSQGMAAAEAIPVLQLIIRSGPERFHEKADSLLQCLPGSLVVTIKRGVDLKQSMGNTNAFCKLTLGSGPPRQTKVISHTTTPEWKQGFAWAFDTPPKGQKLHISCKSKNAFGKGALGKVTIQIDRVVMLGSISGAYTLTPDKNRDGTPRILEIEIQWANR